MCLHKRVPYQWTLFVHVAGSHRGQCTNSSCTSDLCTHNGQETVAIVFDEGIHNCGGQHRKDTVPRSDPNHLFNSLHYVTMDTYS